MKARVKATGEIINIAEYAKIDLDVCDSYGNPIQVSPEDIELIEDKNVKGNTIYWENLKHQYAGMAMQGILSNPEFAGLYEEDCAIRAINMANALIEKLKE